MRYRIFSLSIEKRSGAKTYPATLSTETPVERDFGLEVLSHKQGEVDLARAKRGLPLLWSHDSREVIGRVERIQLTTDRRLRGELRPGTSERAQEIWRDVEEGIIKDLSVGYSYGNSRPTVDPDTGARTFRNWMPLEISLVAVPADAAAGIGRSKTIAKRGKNDMKDIVHDDDPEPKLTYGELENRRARAIRNLCRQNNISHELTDKLAGDINMTVDMAASIILRELKTRNYGTETFEGRELGMSQREIGRYSIAKAINAAASNNWQRAGLELEASRAMAQRMGRQPMGFFVPTDVLMTRTVQKSTGISTIATDVLSGSFIDILRAKTVTLQLGATFLNGLQGDVSIPRQSGTLTGEWVAESTAPTADDMTLDNISLTPKTVGALTSYSRKMLLQSAPGIEGLIMSDLTRVIAVAIDNAAINGSGSGSEPKGLFTYTSGDGIGVVTTSGTLSWAKIVEFESTVAAANADIGNLGYLTSPKVRGVLKSTFTNDTYGEVPIWTRNGDNEICNGYRAMAISLVPDTFSSTNSGMIFGNWADLIIGEWGVLDLATDPYGTNFGKGDVSVRALMDADVAVRHLASFAHATDI
jgi:HK97 family phage major capsid protein/HK97 family phage prohead protease